MKRSLFCLTVLLLPFTALAAPAPAPAPFVSGWGNPVDPDKDCKIRREKDALTIEMPGTVHEYDLRRNYLNAPRLLRDVEGDFEMEVRVRIDCRPSAQSSVQDLPSYVSAGFLVIPPDDFGTAFFRSEYRVGGQGDEAEGCAAILNQGRERGGASGVFTNKHPDWPFKSKPDYVYLRVDRQGELLEMFISPDRKKWKRTGGGGRISELFSKLTVGLAAFSTSTDPSKVVFDQLTITHGKKRERWEFVSGWGPPIDPDKDCKIRREKDALTIEMPGSDYDYDPVRKRFNAPRLLSELEGEFDLQVRVRIDSRPSAPSTVKGQPAFVSAGFLLIFPDKHLYICTRLEYALAQPGSGLGANAIRPWLAKQRRKESVPAGKESDSHAVIKSWQGKTIKPERIKFDHGSPEVRDNLIWERGWQNWPMPEKAEYAYLRLDHRAGGWSSFFISPDGEKWTRLGYLASVPANGKVGLAAYSTSTEPSKVQFDQLKLSQTKR
jgi:regulation of enolase protein 1 (concanavalin A-like superfamily)